MFSYSELVSGSKRLGYQIPNQIRDDHVFGNFDF